MDLMQMLVRSNVQPCDPSRCCDVCTAAENVVWLPPDIRLKPVLQEGDSCLYLISLESLAYSSMVYTISFWQKKNLNVRFYRRICLYVTHLHKDYVLWCYKNTNNFEGNRDNVYLSQLFVRFLLFYRKAILGRDRKCLVETGSPSDSCIGECRKKNPRIVFYSFCFSRVFYELIYCLGKSHHK